MVNIKKIAATAFIFIIIVGGYNFWINTPQYSLLQIQKSVDKKDRDLFDKYVDTNGIIEELVEDVSKLFIEEMDMQQSPEYPFFEPQALVTGFVSLFQPAIEDAIEESFDDFWEDEIETIQIDKSKTDLEDKISLFQMSYLIKEGKVAKLGLESEDPETGEIPLTVGVAYKALRDKMKKEEVKDNPDIVDDKETKKEKSKGKALTGSPKTVVDTDPKVDYKN